MPYLIAEAGVVASHLVRRSPGRALQQVSDLVLQDPVGRQPDRVPHPLGFEELVDLRVGEGRVAAEIAPLSASFPQSYNPAFPGWYRILRYNGSDSRIGYNMLSWIERGSHGGPDG